MSANPHAAPAPPASAQSDSRQAVRGRLAPSPTGYIHLGNAWAFLCAWLAARKCGGTVVLRMEDIDPARAKTEFHEGILRDLAWLGLDWDEGPDVGGTCGPYTQSARYALYEEALEQLRAAGQTYPCFCTRKELRNLAGAPHGPEESVYPGICRNLAPQEIERRLAAGQRAALRFRSPGLPPRFVDAVAGVYPPAAHAESSAAPGNAPSVGLPSVGLPLAGLLPGPPSAAVRQDDIPLRRSDGVFSYQLAVVVDDMAMGINQVVRGNDLLHCTPQQIQLIQALGGQAPEYGHIPLICDAQGERLAKRHSSLEIRALREAGAGPQAVIGYLAWHGGLLAEPSPVNPSQLLEVFELKRLGTAPILLESNILEKILQIS